MRAKIYRADTPNANGVIYPKEVLEKAVEEYNQRTSRFVTFEPYPGDQLSSIDIGKVVGEATLSMEDGYVTANVTVMDTPAAQEMKGLLMKGSQMLPSAIATLKGDTKVVNEDMKIAKLIVSPEQVEVGDITDLFTIEDGQEEEST